MYPLEILEQEVKKSEVKEASEVKKISNKERYDYYLLHKERFDKILNKFSYREWIKNWASVLSKTITTLCNYDFKNSIITLDWDDSNFIKKVIFYTSWPLFDIHNGIKYIYMIPEPKRIDEVFFDVEIKQDDEKYWLRPKIWSFGALLFSLDQNAAEIDAINTTMHNEFRLNLFIDLPTKPQLVYERYEYDFWSAKNREILKQFKLIYVKNLKTNHVEENIIVPTNEFKGVDYEQFIKLIESFPGHKKWLKYSFLDEKQFELYKLKYSI